MKLHKSRAHCIFILSACINVWMCASLSVALIVWRISPTNALTIKQMVCDVNIYHVKKRIDCFSIFYCHFLRSALCLSSSLDRSLARSHFIYFSFAPRLCLNLDSQYLYVYIDINTVPKRANVQTVCVFWFGFAHSCSYWVLSEVKINRQKAFFRRLILRHLVRALVFSLLSFAWTLIKF